jgi:hypothetical protein
MLNDEVGWLSNFTPYSGTSSIEMEQADNALLAGHLNVVRGLLNCDGVSTTLKNFRKIILQKLYRHKIHFLILLFANGISGKPKRSRETINTRPS